MAEEHRQKGNEYQPTVADEGPVETKDRGLFDFFGKKEEEKPQEEVMATEFEKVKISEPDPAKVEEHEKKPGLLEKLHRSDSSSSSSSSDEEGEGGEEKKKKKKEKKGLKDKLKEKISGEKEEEKCEDTTIPVEKCDEVPPVQEPAAHPEEKKGFLDTIKDKLPGHHKKAEEVAAAPPPPPPCESDTVEASAHEGEAKEKKGILEKIKEKLPGYHPKTEEEKEEKESAAH